MKREGRYVLCALILMACFSSSVVCSSERDKKITHVIIVWLNKSGDAVQRQKFLDVSRKLNNSPGIINRHVGVVKRDGGHAVDTSYDVAVSVTLENQQAMDAYMNSPLHQQVIKKQLLPIVRKMITYNFSSQ